MKHNQNQSITIKPVKYRPDLAAELYSGIEALPWAMLLRSASPTHTDSRYDILVAEPVVTLTTFGQETEIGEPGGTRFSSDDPFELLSQLQAQYLPAIEHQPARPFSGGALGYFGYDLGRRVERLPELAEQDIKMPDMAVGLYAWALIVDHQEQSAHLAGPEPEQAWQWLTNHSARAETPFRLSSDWQSNMTRQSYGEKFARVQEYLRSGDCYQINLAQRFSACYEGSEWQAYRMLESVNQAPFSAFIRTGYGAVLSVSPERFLELRNGVIETKPIKGTRPRSEDPILDSQLAAELASAEKDQAENLMIVDLLRNDIGRVARPGSVHVPKLFDIESFPAVHHMVTTIRAELSEPYSPAQLLRAGFPGGSITGAPKIRAMEIIEELEPHRRSVWCGSIGYISRDGQMDTSITIRTLIATNGRLYAWAGGGLVADSECDAEYQETFDKLSRILPVLKPEK